MRPECCVAHANAYLLVCCSSLHRIRIPNISLEVFNVLDSVLNPNPILKLPKQPQTQQPLQQELAGMDQTTTTTIGDGQTAEILDEKRNWSHDVTLQLAKVWNQVQRQYPEQRGALLSQHVYSAFMAAVGNSNRSRKAVDDKMHSMKEMYRFIIAYEENREEGDGKLPWFDLTKPARRQIRYNTQQHCEAVHVPSYVLTVIPFCNTRRSDNKIRVPNLSPQVFHEIDMIMRRTTDATQNNLKNPPTPLSDEIADLDSIARYPFAPTSRLHDGFSSLSTAGQDSAAVSLLNEMNSNSDDPNMVSEADYEAMRRVAAEETSEVDEFTDLQTSGSQLLTPSAVGATTNSLWLRPTKKAKTRHVPTCTPADENVVQSAARIQELVQQLQQMHEHDIEERRAHHKEQMAALHAIIRLLKPDQHATLERNL